MSKIPRNIEAYVYLHAFVDFFLVNVGQCRYKYTSPMDPLGLVCMVF